MEYVFLLNTNDEDSMDYIAVPASKIETINLSETYDDKGNKVGAAEAYDRIRLVSQEAIDITNKLAQNLKISNRFNLQDEVSELDHPNIYDQLLYTIRLDADEEVDYTLDFRTVEGFNYVDEDNAKTIIVSYDDGSVGSYAIVGDAEWTGLLNNAIKESEFVKEENGEKLFTHPEYHIRTNKKEFKWADYVITPIQED